MDQRLSLPGRQADPGSAVSVVGEPRTIKVSLTQCARNTEEESRTFMIWQKPVDEITEADLQGLLDGRVQEVRRLEYKRDLPLDQREARREFVADVCSFANNVGGMLIYGIEAPNGVPESLVGLEGDPGHGILKLHNLIRDLTAPQLSAVEMAAVRLASVQFIIVIRVPRSSFGPHAVAAHGSGALRFHSRTSNGKQLLDVFEVRDAFRRADSVGESIRRFRADRLAMVMARETPAALPDGPVLVLHVVPFAAFDLARTIDVREVYGSNSLLPLSEDFAFNRRYNADGVVVSGSTHRFESDTYVQFFRTGIMEYADGVIVYPGPPAVIPATIVERSAVKAVERSLAFLGDLDLGSPVVVALSLISVRGFRICRTNPLEAIGHELDREILHLPELLIDSYPADVPKALRPMLDVLWQAGGIKGSPNLDAGGN